MQHGAHVRQAEHLNDVAVLERLGRDNVTAHGPVESDADDVAIAFPAAVEAVDTADRSCGDLHEAQIRVGGGRSKGDVEGHFVQLRPDRIGHHRGRLREDLAFPSYVLRQPRSVGILGEPHRRLSLRGFVGRAVHRLGDPDLVDALAGRAEHHADHVRHPGVRAAAEDRRTAALASVDDAFAVRRRLLPTGDPGRAGAHVDARLQQTHQFVDIRPQRVIATRVGAQREQRLDVVGRVHPCRLRPARQFGGIDAYLVRPVRVHPDELHVGSADDGVQRSPPDVAGCPLDHAQ